MSNTYFTFVKTNDKRLLIETSKSQWAKVENYDDRYKKLQADF